jgi:hypothetical protein
MSKKNEMMTHLIAHDVDTSEVDDTSKVFKH